MQYLTVQELQAAPLGVELKNIPTQNALPQANYAELQNIITRATGLIDNYCQQVLRATVNTEEAWTEGRRAGVDREGYLWVKTQYNPVLTVGSFQYQFPGGAWQQVDVTTLIVSGDRQSTILVPSYFQRRGLPRLRIQYTYTNGYPNTQLTGTVAVGATSLPLKELTGILPGSYLTVYDGASTERVQAAASWIPATGAGSLSLASPTLAAHTPIAFPTTGTTMPYDIAVSALPADIRLATLLVCKYQIRERGASTLVMSRAGRVSSEATPNNAQQMPDEASTLLLSYRRVI